MTQEPLESQMLSAGLSMTAASEFSDDDEIDEAAQATRSTGASIPFARQLPQPDTRIVFIRQQALANPPLALQLHKRTGTVYADWLDVMLGTRNCAARIEWYRTEKHARHFAPNLRISALPCDAPRLTLSPQGGAAAVSGVTGAPSRPSTNRTTGHGSAASAVPGISSTAVGSHASAQTTPRTTAVRGRTTDLLTAGASSVSRQRRGLIPQYKYSTIAAASKGQTGHFFGVVMEAATISPTGGTDHIMKMAITDDSLDKPVAVTVVLFVPDERSFLPADYGDVVRLHRVTMLERQSTMQIQGMQRKGSSYVVFAKDGSVRTASASTTITEENRARAAELLAWGRGIAASQSLMRPQYRHTLGELFDGLAVAERAQAKRQIYTDMMVCIARLDLNPAPEPDDAPEESAGGGSEVNEGNYINGNAFMAAVQRAAPKRAASITVWDGTGEFRPLLTAYEPDIQAPAYPPAAGAAASLHNSPYNEGSLLRIWIFDIEDSIKRLQLQPGDWVKLRNVQGAYQPIEAQQDQGPPRQLWIANMKLNDRAVVSKVPAWAYDPKVLLATYAERVKRPAARQRLVAGWRQQAALNMAASCVTSHTETSRPVVSLATVAQERKVPSLHRVRGWVRSVWPATCDAFLAGLATSSSSHQSPTPGGSSKVVLLLQDDSCFLHAVLSGKALRDTLLASTPEGVDLVAGAKVLYKALVPTKVCGPGPVQRSNSTRRDEEDVGGVGSAPLARARSLPPQDHLIRPKQPSVDICIMTVYPPTTVALGTEAGGDGEGVGVSSDELLTPNTVAYSRLRDKLFFATPFRAIGGV